ncbi:MAG: ADP-ribosylglycohydrolase family protein [Candidatus Binatia bacterium]|nr:ADP-ribosylglycohydrolase family protein [Candidatus Binatia bacterium]
MLRDAIPNPVREPSIRSLDRAKGCLLGLATGDALGTTLEFQPRGSFEPIDNLVGGGPFGLRPGEWTDDTSLTICLARSLISCAGFDPQDQAERYLAWRETGQPGPRDYCFDIGNTTATALDRFRQTGDAFSGPDGAWSAGNGSLMRLAPVALFWACDERTAVNFAGESSRVTHGADEPIDACRAYATFLVAALRGCDRETILATTPPRGPDARPLSPAVLEVLQGSWRDKRMDEIRGSGYVVSSLEAAIWCFANTASYREAVLCAANLGEDADTTAAICGQLAGAFYGASSIPASWKERVFMREEIELLAQQLWTAATARHQGQTIRAKALR